MIYDAFISYRHAPLDMEIAKKVHSGLEMFRVPAAVQKKTGKKKINRVFRDQEELPIGSDLNDNISAALRESEYLIVICSPETPGSYWVSKEIDTFIEMHDRHHVLAVLVDGEPDQSFPPQLLCDENGNPVEPLAADVRGADASERNKKLKTELLRLAAPILGCTYDDLRQRHRERILKRNIMIASIAAGIVAVAGAAFGVYNANVARRMKKLADEKAVLAEEKSALADDKTKLADEKSRLAEEKTVLADRILAEYREKQENQSRFYAEKAMMLLEAGNREDAVLVASEGLPSADDDRPFVAEAEYALAAALHAYDSGHTLSADRLLAHDFNVKDMVTDRKGRYLTSVDHGKTVYVWDCETWELLLKLKPTVTSGNYHEEVLAAFANENGLYAAYRNRLVRYDFSGAEQARYDLDDTMSWCFFGEKADTAFCIGTKKITAVSLSTLKSDAEIVNDTPYSFTAKASLSPDGSWFAIGHTAGTDGKCCVSIVNLKDYSTVTVPVSETYIFNLTVTENANVAVVSGNDDFMLEVLALKLDVFRAEGGALIYSRDLPNTIRNNASFSTLIGSHSYEDKSDIVIVYDTDVYSFDEATGEMKAHVPLSDQAVTLDLYENSSTAFIGGCDGGFIGMSTNDGRIYTGSTVTTNATSMVDMLNVYDGIVIREQRSGNLTVLKYHTTADITALPDLPNAMQCVAVAPTSDYYVLLDSGMTNTYRFYDGNGELLYSVEKNLSAKKIGFCGNECILAWSDAVYRVNPVTGTEKKLVYKDLGGGEYYVSAAIRGDGRYLALWNGSGVDVFDLENETHVFSDSKMPSIGALTFCGNRDQIIVARAGVNSFVIDPEQGVVTEIADDSLRQVNDCSSLPYLVCDENGRYAAMACEDGNVRVLTPADGKTVLTVPMAVHSVCFLSFTKDSRYIFLQGDDCHVRVYEIASGKCVNSLEVPMALRYMIEDGERVALCDGYTVSLVDAASFGQFAYVDDAGTYLSKQKAFLLINGRSIRLTKYKDYRALLEEAKRQFPNSVLSEEKKVEYNIE
ncbi:MAG: toll/interleukin-1 receptor domain-containing protein [Lachnospiraceae bacterium]|nr:toll/interleukin-1 receptor domain-containing protein [Lachnospiraceae bacterium]